MAGTVTQTYDTIGPIRRVIFTCTGDASDGSFPATELTTKFNGEILQVVTNPGSTAPTDNYDITLTNADGLDMLGGWGANRDTANTELAVPVFADNFHVYLADKDTLTLNVTGNSVNSATTVITMLYRYLG